LAKIYALRITYYALRFQEKFYGKPRNNQRKFARRSNPGANPGSTTVGGSAAKLGDGGLGGVAGDGGGVARC
jgi:hypothetical protein